MSIKNANIKKGRKTLKYGEVNQFVGLPYKKKNEEGNRIGYIPVTAEIIFFENQDECDYYFDIDEGNRSLEGVVYQKYNVRFTATKEEFAKMLAGLIYIKGYTDLIQTTLVDAETGEETVVMNEGFENAELSL